MRKIVQLLLAICLIGTCIAVVGAALRTSNIQEREELGVLIHRGGMTVMLIGFGGLFLLSKRVSRSRKQAVFRWSDVDGKFSVVPVSRLEILNVSATDTNRETTLRLDRCDLHDVRCLIARGQSIDKGFISRLAQIQQVRVLDLQNATLGDGVIQELETLDCLEVILLAGCLTPSEGKELRMMLPEVKMIFDPR